MVAALIQNAESLFMICGATVAIVAIVVFGGGRLLISALKISADARLKHQMLERGMSPSEIEQVLNAGSAALRGKSPRHEGAALGKPSAKAV